MSQLQRRLSKRPTILSKTTGFLFARQRALNKTGVIFLLHIKTNSCALYSTCMYDKLVTSARDFSLQRAINFISKCGGIELCFKPRGPVKRRCHFLKKSLVYLLESLPTGNLLFIDWLLFPMTLPGNLSNYSGVFRLLEKRVILLEAGAEKFYKKVCCLSSRHSKREVWFFLVFCFLIPFSVFIAEGEIAFIDRFVSFNPVRNVAQV